MINNVKLDDLSKEVLNTLKKDYSFSTYSECITTIGSFFKNNKISPRDVISNDVIKKDLEFRSNEIKKDLHSATDDIKDDIQNLKKFIATDSQSLRKRYGALERDYFKTFDRKIETIYQKIIIEDSLKKERINEQDTTTTQVSNLDNNSTQKDKIKIKEQFDLLNDFQKIVNTQEKTQRNERHIISKIKENISYEKSTFGNTKTILNFSQEELEKLFNIKL